MSRVISRSFGSVNEYGNPVEFPNCKTIPDWYVFQPAMLKLLKRILLERFGIQFVSKMQQYQRKLIGNCNSQSYVTCNQSLSWFRILILWSFRTAKQSSIGTSSNQQCSNCTSGYYSSGSGSNSCPRCNGIRTISD